MNERMTKKEEHLALSVAGKDIQYIFTLAVLWLGNLRFGHW